MGMLLSTKFSSRVQGLLNRMNATSLPAKKIAKEILMMARVSMYHRALTMFITGFKTVEPK